MGTLSDFVAHKNVVHQSATGLKQVLRFLVLRLDFFSERIDYIVKHKMNETSLTTKMNMKMKHRCMHAYCCTLNLLSAN